MKSFKFKEHFFLFFLQLYINKLIKITVETKKTAFVIKRIKLIVLNLSESLSDLSSCSKLQKLLIFSSDQIDSSTFSLNLS